MSLSLEKLNHLYFISHRNSKWHRINCFELCINKQIQRSRSHFKKYLVTFPLFSNFTCLWHRMIAALDIHALWPPWRLHRVVLLALLLQPPWKALTWVGCLFLILLNLRWYSWLHKAKLVHICIKSLLRWRAIRMAMLCFNGSPIINSRFQVI